MKRTIQFVADEDALEKALCDLKLSCCPHCGARGTLNRHDYLNGNDPYDAGNNICRGRRAYCSRRGKRDGCGATICFLFAWVLPRHTWTAGLLSNVCDALSKGVSTLSAWMRLKCGLSLEGLYRLLRRLRRCIDNLRPRLCGCCDPPCSDTSDPLLQTIGHLRCAFSAHESPAKAFQMHFQTPLLG